MNVATGELRPSRCKAYICESCGPWRLREWGWVLAWGLPERVVTLTLASANRERRRGQVRDLCYRLRRRGYRVDWAWSTERNPKGTGLHVHMVQHGDFIPQRELADMWGGRRVWIEAIGKSERSAEYVLKEGVAAIRASGYQLKEAIELDRRPVRLSRGYLRGASVAEAQAAVRELRWGPSVGDWVKVPRSDDGGSRSDGLPPIAEPGGECVDATGPDQA